MKNNLNKNNTKSLQPVHYIVIDVPSLSWRGACNTAPDQFHLPGKGTGSQVQQGSCMRTAVQTNCFKSAVKHQEESLTQATWTANSTVPLLRGNQNKHLQHKKCPTAFKLLFLFYLYLGAGTTSITPPSIMQLPALLWGMACLSNPNWQCPASSSPLFPLSCRHNCHLGCTVTWIGDLSWKATQELKEDWNTNPARLAVCQRNTKVHVPGRWWSKQSEVRECKHSREMASPTSAQPKPNG